MKTNLIYHMFPRVHSCWQYHADLIGKYIDRFNNKKIIGIAVDDTTEDFDTVKEYIQSVVGEKNIRYIKFNNDPVMHQSHTMEEMLAEVESTNKDEITFYGHSKGTTYTKEGIYTNPSGHDNADKMLGILAWSRISLVYSLRDMHRVEEKFKEGYDAFGILKSTRISTAKSFGYFGTFFWIRNSCVFVDGWRDRCRTALVSRWEVESLPSVFMSCDKAYCDLYCNEAGGEVGTGASYDIESWYKTFFYGGLHRIIIPSDIDWNVYRDEKMKETDGRIGWGGVLPTEKMMQHWLIWDSE